MKHAVLALALIALPSIGHAAETKACTGQYEHGSMGVTTIGDCTFWDKVPGAKKVVDMCAPFGPECEITAVTQKPYAKRGDFTDVKAVLDVRRVRDVNAVRAPLRPMRPR